MIRAVYEYCRLIRITVGDNEPNYSGDMYARDMYNEPVHAEKDNQKEIMRMSCIIY